MNRIIRKTMAVIALLAWGALSVWGQAPEKTVEWTVSATDTGNGIFEIVFSYVCLCQLNDFVRAFEVAGATYADADVFHISVSFRFSERIRTYFRP